MGAWTRIVPTNNFAMKLDSTRDAFLRNTGVGVGSLALVAATVVFISAGSSRADWPQWRGPDRVGVATESPALASHWTEDGPPQLWQSEEFPENSGEGSAVAAEGRVYLLLNWGRDDKIRTRKINSGVLGQLRWFDQKEIPPAILSAMEESRLSRPARLRGSKLDEWAKAWVEKEIPDEHKKWRGTAEGRLKEGKEAMSLKVLTKLEPARDREFSNPEAFEKWLDGEGINGTERERIVAAVPTTTRHADDVVMCIDLATGKTQWKRKLPGKPDSSMGSATPTLVDGRLFVLGTTHAHCLDAVTGEAVWTSELPDRESTSSLLVVDKLLVALAGRLVAFDRDSGEIVWKQDQVRGRRSSPSLWRHREIDYIIANSDRKKLSCVRAVDGELLWTASGGGDSSPAVSGDIVVIHSDDAKLGLAAYRLRPDGADELWRLPHEGRGAASPIVYDGFVYLMGGGRTLCAGLETGEVHWSQDLRVEISSPFLADGKIFTLEGNGSNLFAFDASPKELRQIGKARMQAAWCPSPGFSGGLALIRHKKFLACYDLRTSGRSAE
jgi:outer membrane protein assembly factor BamB